MADEPEPPEDPVPFLLPSAGLDEVPPPPDAIAEPPPPPEPIAVGTTVAIERGSPAHQAELSGLDWLRSLHPAMAGPAMRSGAAPFDSVFVVRSLESGSVIGVIDALEVPGYERVMNVSVYTDTDRAKGGQAIEAYILLVPWLFEQGARLIHHEVLELNRPIIRVMRAIGVKPSARFREHAYSAGRHWDVVVFAYDREQFEHVLAKVVPRAGEHVRRARTPQEN
jgi:RimJ/RimL family protein N-acetyltransferase